MPQIILQLRRDPVLRAGAETAAEALCERARDRRMFQDHRIECVLRDADVAGQFGDRHVEMRQHIFAQDFAWVGRRDVGPFVDGFEGDVKGHGGPWD